MCRRPVRDRCCAIRCGAPLCAWRTTNMSAFIATRLSMVSSRVSPLLVDDTPMLRLITSADNRLAAISNVVRVRVLLSKKRLNTALPRSSGTFFTSRSAIDTKGIAVSRMRRITSAGNPSSVSKCVSSPRSFSCGLFTRRTPSRLDRQLEASVGVAIEHDGEIPSDSDARTDVRGFDRQFTTAAIDEYGELDRLGPAVVEQFVDRRANRAAGVEHVVDQDDTGPDDVERERGRLDLGAQAFRGVIVAIERDVDVADRMISGEQLRQAIGEPRTTRKDPDQLRVDGNGAAHALRKRSQRRFGVRQSARWCHARQDTPAG